MGRLFTRRSCIFFKKTTIVCRDGCNGYVYYDERTLSFFKKTCSFIVMYLFSIINSCVNTWYWNCTRWRKKLDWNRCFKYSTIGVYENGVNYIFSCLFEPSSKTNEIVSERFSSSYFISDGCLWMYYVTT